MKKLVFGLVATVIFSFNSHAKSLNKFGNENYLANEKQVIPLNENKDFIDLVLETENFNNFLYETIKKNSLETDSITSQMTALLNQDLSYENQIIEINKIFKSDVSKELTSNIKLFSEKFENLSKEYDMRDEKLVKDAYGIVLVQLIENNMLARGWRYNLCIVAAGAGAVLCHAACDTTALATTAGLGIPACVALCGTLQVAASVQCWDNYK